MRRLAVALLVLALSGCASTVAAPEPTPTWINCDTVVGTEPIGTCPPPSGDGAPHPENEAYRERIAVSPEDQARLDALVGPATTALQPIADGSDPITGDAVVAALVSAGFAEDEVQVTDGPAVAFGASTGFGCVFGGVWAGRLEVEAGGFIRDGGCLALSGH